MKDDKIQYGTISVLSIAHLINDTYSNFLPQFLPFLIASTNLSYAKATFLISVFTVSSSVIQPLLGFFIDKQGKSWLLYVGTLWMTVFLSLLGFTNNYMMMVVLSGLAGIGTAVFHPQASSLMGEIAGNKKGFMMSAFMAMGNFGFALSPLIFVPMLGVTGIRGTVYLLIPGILVSIFLLVYTKVPASESKLSKEQNINSLKVLREKAGELSNLITVILLRSAAYTGLIALLPNYFKEEKISAMTSGTLMFMMLFSGVLGGIFGGWISDRVGRKPVIVISMILSSFAFFGFFYTSGMLSYALLALAGSLLMGSFSVTVVAAQELIPDNRGLASGISMGFSIGLGGLAITLVGWLADIYGIRLAVQLLFVLPAIGGSVSLLLGKQVTEQVTIPYKG